MGSELSLTYNHYRCHITITPRVGHLECEVCMTGHLQVAQQISIGFNTILEFEFDTICFHHKLEFECGWESKTANHIFFAVKEATCLKKKLLGFLVLTGCVPISTPKRFFSFTLKGSIVFPPTSPLYDSNP